MEDYELAMSFGSELVHHTTASLKGFNYIPNGYLHNPLTRPRFDAGPAVIDAVVNLMCLGRNDIVNCYHEVRAIIDGDAKIFAKLALEAAVAYFPSGYTHPAFLSFCAMVIGVATICYENDYGKPNRGQIMDSAGGVIGTVLFGHLLGAGFSGPSEWTEVMLKVAGEFNKFANPQVRGLKMKLAKSKRDERSGRKSDVTWFFDSRGS